MLYIQGYVTNREKTLICGAVGKQNDIQTHASITKLHHQLFWLKCTQGGFAHHFLSALSSGRRLLQGPGENQGSQLLHRMDFLDYYLCLHSFLERFKVLSPTADTESVPRERDREKDVGCVFHQEALQSINVFDVTYHVPCYANCSLLETQWGVFICPDLDVCGEYEKWGGLRRK